MPSGPATTWPPPPTVSTTASRSPAPDPRYVLAAALGDHEYPTGILGLAVHAGGDRAEQLAVTHVEAIPEGTTIEAIADHLVAVADQLSPSAPRSNVRVVVEATQTPAPALRSLTRIIRDRRAVTVLALPEGGGHPGPGVIVVARRDLVGAATLAVEQGRLSFPAGAPGVGDLVADLRGYRHPAPGSGPGGADPWRVHARDHYVLALAAAVREATRPAVTILAAARVLRSGNPGGRPEIEQWLRAARRVADGHGLPPVVRRY